MPHQCTNCDLTFEDGSKEMLGGCPECGGNKFQFLPSGQASRSERGGPEAVGETGGASSPSNATASSPSVALESSGTSLESTLVGDSPADPARPDDDIIEAPAEPVEAIPDGEDRAQASARRDVVSEDELPPAEAVDGSPETAEDTPEDDRPGLTQLRQELNDQFESIKIHRPGEYELNLMELYDRDEYIIALEEDGRYVIDVPDTWRDEG